MQISRTLSSLLAAFGLVICIDEAAAGLLVTGVTPSTTMGAGFGTSLLNTVNGAGLTGGVPGLTATHAGTLPSNSWVSSTGVLSGNIDFQFSSIQNIDGFSFWNQNGGGPGATGSTGIRGVSVLSSIDGVNFSPVTGAPSFFTRVTGGGLQLPQQIAFSPVLAAAVRFVVNSNHGDAGQTGFAEVQFSAIPEPATLIYGLGVLSILALGPRPRSSRR